MSDKENKDKDIYLKIDDYSFSYGFLDKGVNITINDETNTYYNSNRIQIYSPDVHGQKIFDMILDILDMSYEDMIETFGTRSFPDILRQGYETVKEKYEKWKIFYAFKIGDEITDGERTGIIICFTNDKKGFYCLTKDNGARSYFSISKSKKTNKHFPEIAAYLKGEEKGEE